MAEEYGKLGAKLAEGKTKVIYESADDKSHVIIVSKNSISAGNGAKRDELPGKAQFSTTTTCNVFRLLQLSGIPTHFVKQESPVSIRVLNCAMIPLEVIVRRLAAGSYLKRHPQLKQGDRFDPVVVEFTFKDDALGDPLISDEEIVARSMTFNGVNVDQAVVEQLKRLAAKAFEAVEAGWRSIDVALVDFKVEFGVTRDGHVVLADVIDNDSWRIWPRADPTLMKDKQVYRNLPVGALSEQDLSMLVGLYDWAAQRSAYLLDSLLQPNVTGALVGIIMGSQSDWETMREAALVLQQLGVPFETRIVSAHRTPERLFAYAKSARARGLRVIIAGAGGAAHLPGMAASMTSLPVLGVPVQSSMLSGVDSLLSIVQMPSGVPVGTLAIGKAGAANAGLLAASILGCAGPLKDIGAAYEALRKRQTESVADIPKDAPSLQEPAKAVAAAVPAAVSAVQKVLSASVAPVVPPTPPKFADKLIPPGATIGVVGGGQLAKMIAVAAAQLGYKCNVFCPDKTSPAFQVCDAVTVADYTDVSSLNAFASKVDVVTYEFENVPDLTIDHLSQWVPVHPDARILGVCQHRVKEKTFINGAGVPTAAFAPIGSLDELRAALDGPIGYPAVFKSNTGGYDGKGQRMIRTKPEDPAALEKLYASMRPMLQDGGILEAFVDFEMEVSVIVARNASGRVVTFPVTENRHANHVLKHSIVPAGVSDAVRQQAEQAAVRLAEALGLVGVLAVEMFVTRDGRVLVNELAPRPHNSGHWTIEGCATSQFEQLVRCICGLPLGSTRLRSQRVEMINLLGDDVNSWQQYLTDERAHLHLYGKHEAREGRKMGHVTFLNDQ